MTQKITPFIWLDHPLSDVLDFYASVFPDAEVVDRMMSDDDGRLFIVTFRASGLEFTVMDSPGGPPLTGAISFAIDCVDQAEVDRVWDALLAGGGEPQQCGWLADRFGVNWQVVPHRLLELQADPDPGRRKRAIDEMLTQVKLDIAAIERAADAI
ncbi:MULTISPECIES: VOC family protein [unclassified Salinibacterium]|uniref:VOC family protein n=1 Tax=unclassified Salinibacterium TaxID=2632331 RepID=UPI001423F6BF|nr:MULTISPECIES: VOC family protein [unclassified Salinibacterium]